VLDPGDDVLVFSDKCCSFPDTGDVQLDWSRWFRKAVSKSADQVWGAERWLREHPDLIFLDRACSKPLPLPIPPASKMRVHRIVVAHNVAARCAKFFPGSSRTLMFDSSINGKDHYANPERVRPFYVGWLDAAQSFVHVLDDDSLEILLHMRDTVTDFVDYLRWKEELVCEGRRRGVEIVYCGEEDLLTNYLLTFDNGRHGFTLPADVNVFSLDEGDWQRFRSSPKRTAQVAADAVSYFWDELIEKFNKNILGGTSVGDSSPLVADRERIMRFFAREPRLSRRFLANALLSLVRNTPQSHRATRVVLPHRAGDPYYCFLVMPTFPKMPREEYREARGRLLQALCYVTKIKFPDAIDIVGLATEVGIDAEPRSEDAAYLDTRNWDEESDTYARKLQLDLGLLTNTSTNVRKVEEFPVPETTKVSATGPNPRNKPCPCGSGKKFKKCHGK
jgi:hypothetical protein